MRITLLQFQQIDEFMSREDLSERDKHFHATCIVYNLLPSELNAMNIKRVFRMQRTVNRLLEKESKRKAQKILKSRIVNYDPSSYTLGQFITLQSYATRGAFKFAHKILSVITGEPDTTDERAEEYLNLPISKISGSLKLFLSNFKEFLERYKGLFGIDRDDANEVEVNPFQKQWGWIFSATRVADHNRISLDEAMGLNIKVAFHDLAYLKAKDKYDEQQIKKK